MFFLYAFAKCLFLFLKFCLFAEIFFFHFGILLAKFFLLCFQFCLFLG